MISLIKAKAKELLVARRFHSAVVSSLRDTYAAIANLNEIARLPSGCKFSLDEVPKSSETLFVLGCGPSINKLTSKDWSKISSFETCGFNFWLAHEIAPTHYFYYHTDETYNALISCRQKLINTNIISRSLSFSDVAPNLLEAISQVGNPYIAAELSLHSDFSLDLADIHNLLLALGYFNKSGLHPFLLKFYNTLGLILPWAAKAGYQNIVLAGFDMEQSTYFWQDSFKLRHYSNLPFKLPSFSHAKLHTSSRFMSVTTPAYLRFFANWAKEYLGVKVYHYKCSNLMAQTLPEIKL